MDKSSRQRIDKAIEIPNDTTGQLEAIDIFRTVHPEKPEHILSSAHGTCSKIEHVQGLKTSLQQI